MPFNGIFWNHKDKFYTNWSFYAAFKGIHTHCNSLSLKWWGPESFPTGELSSIGNLLWIVWRKKNIKESDKFPQKLVCLPSIGDTVSAGIMLPLSPTCALLRLWPMYRISYSFFSSWIARMQYSKYSIKLRCFKATA